MRLLGKFLTTPVGAVLRRVVGRQAVEAGAEFALVCQHVELVPCHVAALVGGVEGAVV